MKQVLKFKKKSLKIDQNNSVSRYTVYRYTDTHPPASISIRQYCIHSLLRQLASNTKPIIGNQIIKKQHINLQHNNVGLQQAFSRSDNSKYYSNKVYLHCPSISIVNQLNVGEMKSKVDKCECYCCYQERLISENFSIPYSWESYASNITNFCRACKIALRAYSCTQNYMCIKLSMFR